MIEMYIGPTIQNVIKRNTVYSNGHPNVPDVLKKLIVPIEHVSICKEKIKQKGSAYNTFYNRALEYSKGVR